MPCLVIKTNVTKVPDNFLAETSSLVASLLGKPESYVAISIQPGVKMSFGGTEDPCAISTLMSIGSISRDKNKKTSKALSDHIKKTLGVPSDRMYITFYNAPSEDVGFNAGTFA